MTALANRADFTPMASTNDDEESRSAVISRRFSALGISDREWHAQTGIDRKTLHRAMSGEPGTRATTYMAIETWLDRIEARNEGRPIALPSIEGVEGEPSGAPGVVRFIVKNVYGAEALVVEVPPGNIAELEQAVDRIMRNLRGES